MCCFPVSLVTALKLESELPMCLPTPNPTETDDIATVMVDDRTVELALMDNDPSTCLQAFVDENQFLTVVLYIYVPSCLPNVHVMLYVTGVACPDPSITVYHHVSTVDQCGFLLQECIPVVATNRFGQPLQCQFMCQSVCAASGAVTVGIRIVKVSWNMMEPVKVCGINVANYPD